MQLAPSQKLACQTTSFPAGTLRVTCLAARHMPSLAQRLNHDARMAAAEAGPAAGSVQLASTAGESALRPPACVHSWQHGKSMVHHLASITDYYHVHAHILQLNNMPTQAQANSHTHSLTCVSALHTHCAAMHQYAWLTYHTLYSAFMCLSPATPTS